MVYTQQVPAYCITVELISDTHTHTHSIKVTDPIL
jgi:hypothetical protein